MQNNKCKKNFSSFWQETRIPLFIISALFITGILLGILMPEIVKVWLLQAVTEKFSAITQGTETAWDLGLKIFLNNLLVTFILFSLAITIIIPIIVLLSNGIIIGVFVDLGYYLDALEPGTFFTSLISLIPHGIFEIPAFILSAVFGICLGLKIMFGSKIFNQRTRLQSLRYYIKLYLIIIIPLLIFAGLLEVTVSDYVLTTLTEKNRTKYIDTSLTMNLDKQFLVNNNCHAAGDIEQAKSSISASILELGTAYYNEDLQSVYRVISRLPHWQKQYACQDNSLRTIVYPYKNYTLKQARADQKKILEVFNYNVIEIEKNIFQATDNENIIYYSISNINDKIIITFWDGEDRDMLNKLIFSPTLD